jgi:hypothetical protein
MSNNTQHSVTDEAELLREMTVVLAVARKNLRDEAMAQAYMLVRFLSDPVQFATAKRLLERVLRRPIQLQKPFTYAEFTAAFERTGMAGAPATILEFRAPTKH